MIKYLLVVVGRWRTAVLSWRNPLLLAPHPPASLPIGFLLIPLGWTAAAGNVRRLQQTNDAVGLSFPVGPLMLEMTNRVWKLGDSNNMTQERDSLLPLLPRFQLLCSCHCGGRWQQGSQHSHPRKRSTGTRPQTCWIMEALRHHR